MLLCCFYFPFISFQPLSYEVIKANINQSHARTCEERDRNICISFSFSCYPFHLWREKTKWMAKEKRDSLSHTHHLKESPALVYRQRVRERETHTHCWAWCVMRRSVCERERKRERKNNINQWYIHTFEESQVLHRWASCVMRHTLGVWESKKEGVCMR